MPPAPPLSLADYIADPDAALARARETGTVAATDLGPLVVSYEGVRSMLQDPRLRPSFTTFLEQTGISSGPFYDWMRMSPLDMEGDEHRRWRQLMVRTFTPRSVERLRPFLKTECERLVKAFAPRGRAEFVSEFARQLPALGLCELIGVPAEDRERFGSWADTIGLGFNVMLLPAHIAEVDAALVELLAYAKELVAKRLAEPRDDLVTRLAQGADQDGITLDRVHGSVAGLVFAGHETTKNQLGWLLAVLSEVPAEWDRVAREPSHAKDVVEEVLRFRAAVTSVGRMVTEDMELFGAPLAAGTFLVGSLWSANRDATAFPKPGSFDAEANREGAQIAFGHGVHHCLGAALARAELQESLIALAATISCPKLEPGATFLPPVGINGPTALPISFRLR